MVSLAAALAVMVGCSADNSERPLPVACQSGQEAVEAALASAPQAVRLEGVPLSDCFDPKSDGAELQGVGISLVGAASALGERARAQPEGEAATQLGYLIGAMRRGAGRTNAQGIHTELVRRAEQELTLVDPSSQALQEGLRAGERTG